MIQQDHAPTRRFPERTERCCRADREIKCRGVRCWIGCRVHGSDPGAQFDMGNPACSPSWYCIDDIRRPFR